MYCSCYGRHTCTLVHLVLVGNWGMDIRHYGQSSFTTGAYLHTCIGPVSITNIQTLYLTLFFSSKNDNKTCLLPDAIFAKRPSIIDDNRQIKWWDNALMRHLVNHIIRSPLPHILLSATCDCLLLFFLFFSSNDKSSFDFVSLKHRYSSSKIHISIQRLNIHKLGKVPDVQFCICCFSQNK